MRVREHVGTAGMLPALSGMLPDSAEKEIAIQLLTEL
jgi:hypothetical protein